MQILLRVLKRVWRIMPPNMRTKIYYVRRVLHNLPVIPNPTLAEDGLISQHLVEFLYDPRFVRAYLKGKETGALDAHPGDIRFRAYIACWAATYAMDLEGDFVECGAGRGMLSRTIVEYLDFSKSSKRLYLFDTYDGIPLEYGKSSEMINIKRLNKSHYSQPYYQQTLDTFSAFPNVELIKGILPESLGTKDLVSISYLSIDLNNAYAEIETIKILWDSISKGGVILLDDYSYGTEYIEQKKAWDLYAESKNVSILTLPTGQGLIIKSHL